MITLKRIIDDEDLVGDIEIISSTNEVLRRIWMKPDGTIFLDATYEYDEYGNDMSIIYLDDKQNIVGTYECVYQRDSKSLVLRIERDFQGSELHSFHYVYDNDGTLYKVNVFNHEVLVGYGLLIYPHGKDTDIYDIRTNWFDANDQLSDSPFELDTIWERAKKIYGLG